ncbi:MAG: nucleotidyltransferase domain-containing protein [Dehalococcoidia bacterium]|jgi:hypothetical protein|nr:nucleotidyltransferase domain-containing protein [Dehalococcoidia bacterium]
MLASIEQHQDEIATLCERFGVLRLELFGSATGGTYRTGESDLDFLVEFIAPEAPGYADRYFGLLEALEALFGRPVDLVVPSAITNPHFQRSVDATRTPLYAA